MKLKERLFGTLLGIAAATGGCGGYQTLNEFEEGDMGIVASNDLGNTEIDGAVSDFATQLSDAMAADLLMVSDQSIEADQGDSQDLGSKDLGSADQLMVVDSSTDSGMDASPKDMIGTVIEVVGANCQKVFVTENGVPVPALSSADDELCEHNAPFILRQVPKPNQRLLVYAAHDGDNHLTTIKTSGAWKPQTLRAYSSVGQKGPDPWGPNYLWIVNRLNQLAPAATQDLDPDPLTYQFKVDQQNLHPAAMFELF